MFTHKNLMTVCCAAVLAFGLAACGSSSSSDDDKVATKKTTPVVPVKPGEPVDTAPTDDEIAAATKAAGTKSTAIAMEAAQGGLTTPTPVSVALVRRPLQTIGMQVNTTWPSSTARPPSQSKA